MDDRYLYRVTAWAITMIRTHAGSREDNRWTKSDSLEVVGIFEYS